MKKIPKVKIGDQEFDLDLLIAYIIDIIIKAISFFLAVGVIATYGFDIPKLVGCGVLAIIASCIPFVVRFLLEIILDDSNKQPPQSKSQNNNITTK